MQPNFNATDMNFKAINELFTQWGDDEQIRKALFAIYKDMVDYIMEENIHYDQNTKFGLFLISKIIDATEKEEDNNISSPNNNQ